MKRGNQENVRWIIYAGDQFSGSSIKSDENLMQFSALPHADEQIYPMEYSIDLPESTSTVNHQNIEVQFYNHSVVRIIKWPRLAIHWTNN